MYKLFEYLFSVLLVIYPEVKLLGHVHSVFKLLINYSIFLKIIINSIYRSNSSISLNSLIILYHMDVCPLLVDILVILYFCDYK